MLSDHRLCALHGKQTAILCALMPLVATQSEQETFAEVPMRTSNSPIGLSHLKPWNVGQCNDKYYKRTIRYKRSYPLFDGNRSPSTESWEEIT